MLPTALQDTHIRTLAQALGDRLNARLHEAFDAAALPRIDAVRAAVPYNADLKAINIFPLLAVFRTSCIDFQAGRWNAIARWSLSASTQQADQQQDFLYRVAIILMDELEGYDDGCLEVEPDSLNGELGPLQLATIGPNGGIQGLTFPSVEVRFIFQDRG